VTLANCGELGLDWERASLSMYLEAASSRDPDAKLDPDDPTDIERLRKFHRARKG